MKKVLILFIFLFSFEASAQQKKAVTYQQQVQSQRAVKDAPKAIPETRFRILALFEEAFTSPKDLNDYRTQQINLGAETFSNLSGFSASFGYKSGSGIFSLELDQHNQKLSSYSVSSTFTVRDSIESETVQLTYDRVFQSAPEDSFELGIGAGKALKMRYVSYITISSAGNPNNETGVTWEDTPYVFKVRGAYNYYFSANVGLRLALGYQFFTTDQLKAAENYSFTYQGTPITSGRVLKDANGNDVKLDLSGFTAALGLSVNF
jgi:hypothetical protein